MGSSFEQDENVKKIICPGEDVMAYSEELILNMSLGTIGIHIEDENVPMEEEKIVGYEPEVSGKAADLVQIYLKEIRRRE